MASILRVNTLTDASSNNSIAMSFVAGGSAKLWANIDQIDTAQLVDSLNCSGITDNGTGDVSVALTSNMGNATYVPSGMTTSNPAGGGSGEDEGLVTIDTKANMTTSSNRHTTIRNDNDSKIDYDPVCVIYHGDLA
jgi:hypothetical protein